jgi:hypothetical protein
VRLGYAVLGGLSIISVAGAQTRAANLIWTGLTLAFVVWGGVVFALLSGGRHRPWLKYVSVAVDTTLFHGLLIGSLHNHSTVYEVFRCPTMWLWIAVSNGITGFRASWRASVLAGCLTIAYGTSLIVYARVALDVPWVGEATYLGPGLYLGDCALDVFASALPAFFAGVVAWRARVLVDRAVREAALRDEADGELRRQIARRSDQVLQAVLQDGDASLAAGAPLGDWYQVIRPIGRGGAGAVYEVERVSDGRRLAAKVLIAGGADRIGVARLAREAKILAQLDHPNLIVIHDVDVTERGALFIVMELVDGTSLRDEQTAFGAADPGRALEVLGQVAGALAALHAQGIVHRDLKPENVLVERGGRVKLADFGISILLEDHQPQAPAALAVGGAYEQTQETSRAPSRPELTRTGAIVGTPRYMAPELATGSKHARPPADVFSLGVMAHELLTGELPFARPPVMATSLGEEQPPACRLADRPGLLAGLGATLDRCLLVDPAARPSAAELAAALAGRRQGSDE